MNRRTLLGFFLAAPLGVCAAPVAAKPRQMVVTELKIICDEVHTMKARTISVVEAIRRQERALAANYHTARFLNIRTTEGARHASI